MTADAKNCFLAANSFTNSMSFIAEKEFITMSLAGAKITRSDSAKVRFKIEPESKFIKREMALMVLSHNNLISLLGCVQLKGHQMYMYPYYEYTLQMIWNKLPANTIHIYDANVPRKISLEILSALKFLHKEKMSHRGIKASNIYIKRVSRSDEWLQNEDFVSILGENSVLKCEKIGWQSTYCEPDSGLITPESTEEEFFGNDPIYITAKDFLEERGFSFEFDHWQKFDLMKAIELIVELYGFCGFSNNCQGGIINDFESMTFMQEFSIEDLESHPIFMTKHDSFIMLQTVAQKIGENYKVFCKEIDKRYLEKIVSIGNVLLRPYQNWLMFLNNDKNTFENNLIHPGKILVGKRFEMFLNFVHIVLKHVPEMKLSLLGITDKWSFMNYITQKVPTCLMQIFHMQNILKQSGLIAK